MERDYFSILPKEMLNLILDLCELKELGRLAIVCKRFYRTICNEEFFKKRCERLWYTIVPTKNSISTLNWAKDTVKHKSWRKILKCLSNPNPTEYSHHHEPELKFITLGYFNEDENVAGDLNAVLIQLGEDDSDTCVTIGQCVYDGNGYGERFWKDGDSCRGNWKEHIMDGNSEYHYKIGSRYIGEWNGNKHGKGNMYFFDGSTYCGEWDNDTRHGQGKMMWTDGMVYEGEWVNHEPKETKDCIHPTIRKKIQKKICTLDKENDFLAPQFLQQCQICTLFFCGSCLARNCHTCKEEITTPPEWFDGADCDCPGLECKIPPTKLKLY
eukprot:TRINITY_DN6335_c0_g1_i1.p1 TRINITY_DN6335_c0_g1~~TRINITY_DN6335_c0_g1_i1.p1  ORF type:complete len:326 (-),score=50.97 TRINITY_DN6335_c0_g1_i1:18-995(-)